MSKGCRAAYVHVAATGESWRVMWGSPLHTSSGSRKRSEPARVGTPCGEEPVMFWRWGWTGGSFSIPSGMGLGQDDPTRKGSVGHRKALLKGWVLDLILQPPRSVSTKQVV